MDGRNNETPETEIITDRGLSIYEITMGVISVIFTVLSIAMILTGDGTFVTWLGVLLFGSGVVFFVKDLRAPKPEIVLASDRLVERVGDFVMLDLTWSEIGKVEALGKNENVTIYRKDLEGNILELPKLPEFGDDHKQKF